MILSEDIGIAEPMLPAVIDALHRTWAEARQARKGDDGMLPTLHAVVLMAKARKSRMVNHALIVHANEPRREPPCCPRPAHLRGAQARS